MERADLTYRSLGICGTKLSSGRSVCICVFTNFQSFWCLVSFIITLYLQGIFKHYDSEQTGCINSYEMRNAVNDAG